MVPAGPAPAVALLGAAAAATCWVVRRLTGSPWIALTAALTAGVMMPRLYNYPKILVPALAFIFGERFWWPARVDGRDAAQFHHHMLATELEHFLDATLQFLGRASRHERLLWRQHEAISLVGASEGQGHRRGERNVPRMVQVGQDL